jgi:hypothetical protein
VAASAGEQEGAQQERFGDGAAAMRSHSELLQAGGNAVFTRKLKLWVAGIFSIIWMAHAVECRSEVFSEGSAKQRIGSEANPIYEWNRTKWYLDASIDIMDFPSSYKVRSHHGLFVVEIVDPYPEFSWNWYMLGTRLYEGLPFAYCASWFNWPAFRQITDTIAFCSQESSTSTCQNLEGSWIAQTTDDVETVLADPPSHSVFSNFALLWCTGGGGGGPGE